MKPGLLLSRRWFGMLGVLLAGATAPCGAQPRTAVDTIDLDAAFRTCASLSDYPFAAGLMHTIGDEAARKTFATDHSASVRSVSFEQSTGYATATAILNEGISVAGIPVRAVYASTCERQCALSVWGLEMGKLNSAQQSALRQWVASAPTTHTDYHGDIKVQLNTTSDGQTVLVCDVGG